MKRPLLLIALLVVSGLVAIACSDSKNTAGVKTYSGTLIQITLDSRTGPSQTKWQLEEASHKRYWITWARPVYIPPANSAVTITGQLEKETIRKAKALNAVPRHSVLRTLKEGETVQGPTNMAWIAYTWTGVPAPWTKAEIESYGLTDTISVKKFWEAMSFGKVKPVRVEPDVYGPYTLSIPQDCNKPYAEEQARLKANANGFSEGNYSNFQFIYPEPSGKLCSTSADSPGKRSAISIGNTGTEGLSSSAYPGGPSGAKGVQYMAHEIAHNFQAKHAGALICANGATGLPYTSAETGCQNNPQEDFGFAYGNEYDTEGQGFRSNNWNARLKWQLGWWTSSQVKEVTETGNYTVEPDETNEAGIHLLAIKRPGVAPCTPSGNSAYCKEYYYVEFHQPIKPWSDYTEIEAAHPTRGAALYDGAWVQLSGAPETTANKHETRLLYMNPTVSPCCSEDEWITKAVALKASQTYEETAAPHIKIKTESVSAAGAVVKVTIPPGGEIPKGVDAKGVSASQVAVTWNAVANATSYKLYRDGVLIVDGIESGPRWLDSERIPNKSYSYTVRAVTSEGTSELSAPATGLTLGTDSARGGIVGWVDTGKEEGLAEKVPLALAKVEVKKGAEAAVETTTSEKGFWFIKELAAPVNTEYTVKITKSGYFSNSRVTVVIPNHAQLHIVNLGANGVGGEILWKGDGSEILEKQWSEVAFWNGTSCTKEVAPKVSLEGTHYKLETTGEPVESSAHKRAIRFETFSSDGGCYTEDSRVELANFNTRGFKAGDEAWFAWEVSPGGTTTAGILPQWHAKGGCGNPPVSVDMATDGSLHVEVSYRAPGATCPNPPTNQHTGKSGVPALTAKMKVGEWTKIVTRIKFNEGAASECDPAKESGCKRGEVEVFVNGKEEFLKVGMPTMGEGEVKTRIGIYDGLGVANKVYIAGFTAATTREKAEENAF